MADQVDIGSDDDQCPLCKSTRYLNPNMVLLVDPVCYHKICSACVDRIFASGPQKCPRAGCNKTLRHKNFKKPTFGDLKVEREVDLRREINAVFNRREEEFDTLLDYNNYLEDKENITFNLVNNIDLQKTRELLDRYKAENKESILKNAELDVQDREAVRLYEMMQKEHSDLAREARLAEFEEEREQRLAADRQRFTRLMQGNQSNAPTKAEPRVQLKKSGVRKEAEERARQAQLRLQEADAAMNKNEFGSNMLALAGLRKAVEPTPLLPYDSFGDLVLRHKYFSPQDNFVDPWYDGMKNDIKYISGGYSFIEFYSRVMLEGHAGIGVEVGL